jgi:hypothetical protein
MLLGDPCVVGVLVAIACILDATCYFVIVHYFLLTVKKNQLLLQAISDVPDDPNWTFLNGLILNIFY